MNEKWLGIFALFVVLGAFGLVVTDSDIRNTELVA